jgi:hypothetical protein
LRLAADSQKLSLSAALQNPAGLFFEKGGASPDPAICARKCLEPVHAKSEFRTRFSAIVIALSFAEKYCRATAALVDHSKVAALSKKG